MSEYSVLFVTKLSAENKQELNKKAEQISEYLRKQLKKKVSPYGYASIEKKDQIQTTLEV